MTAEDWLILVGLIDEWWPGKFDESTENAWRLALAGFDAAQVTGALKILLARGGTFRPSVAEVVAQIRHDPSKPTFVEAYRLIYGLRGILRARPAETSFADEGERGRAYRRAQRDRAAGMHPLVASFVDRYGLDRLERLELGDPDYGDAKRRDLEAAYGAHCEAMDGRDLALIALPRSDRSALARLDPLAALGVKQPALQQSTGPEES